MAQKLISIVVPVFNEQESVLAFHQSLVDVLRPLPYEFVITFVNDGSQDATGALLETLRQQNGNVEVLELSRNFGHQAALSAGLDHAKGDIVITLDGDGQHPVSLIPAMLQKLEEGFDVVLTQRVEDAQKSSFKHQSSKFFYRLINKIGNTNITPGGADFRAMNRNVVEALKRMPEYHRFLRGMVAWAGYKTFVLPFEPAPRLAGSSKYTLGKMVRLSMDAIFSFSLLPLYFSISLGALLLLLSLLEVVYVLSLWLGGKQHLLAPGWSSLMFVLLFIGGSLMVVLGIIGIYVGYIFQQVKQRPVYFVRQIYPTRTTAITADTISSNDRQTPDV